MIIIPKFNIFFANATVIMIEFASVCVSNTSGMCFFLFELNFHSQVQSPIFDNMNYGRNNTIKDSSINLTIEISKFNAGVSYDKIIIDTFQLNTGLFG